MNSIVEARVITHMRLFICFSMSRKLNNIYNKEFYLQIYTIYTRDVFRVFCDSRKQEINKRKYFWIFIFGKQHKTQIVQTHS